MSETAAAMVVLDPGGESPTRRAERTVEEYRTKALQIKAGAAALVIVDDRSNQEAVDYLVSLGELRKAIQAAKTDACRPMREEEARVRGVFDAVGKPLEEADVELRRKVTEFAVAEKKRAEAAAREKAEAEAKARDAAEAQRRAVQAREKAEAEARAAAEKAERERDGAQTYAEFMASDQTVAEAQAATARVAEADAAVAVAREALDTAAIAAATTPTVVAPQKTVRTETGARVTLKTEKVWEMINEKLIPREYLTVDRAAITAAVRRGVEEIPGIKISERPAIAAGRRA